MIRFDHVSVRYDERAQPVLRDVDLVIDEGELALVVGRTGVGKSTLLGAINGLVPHFTGGTLSGRVVVDGRDTRTHPPRELADVVGVVGQDPLAGFVTDTVEEELAYAMEQLALAPDVMRKRVEETLDLLGLAGLRDRPLRALSGGQQQRVAIGSVLTAHPRVLVLDEPTSALDPTAGEEVLAAITRLVHDLGTTVVIAEHRLERVVQYADRVIHLTGDGRAEIGAPAEILAHTDVAPPVVELGRLAGWTPLPLSVRDARRAAAGLRDRLDGAAPDGRGHARAPRTEPKLRARRVSVRYGAVIAVRSVDLDLYAGEVVGCMGRNGSGKSSLCWALQGSGVRDGGSVEVGGVDPVALAPAARRRAVALVPQTPSDLLYHPTVARECEQTDHETGSAAGATRALLDRILPGVPDDAHPHDLSEGQRLGLVLAVQLVATPEVVLLDEPTRGLDYPAKERLAAIVRELAANGHAVVIATHDVEFVAHVTDRVIVLADGEIVADGVTADVVVASPAFAPQVAKILAPAAWLTVDEVRAALHASPEHAMSAVAVAADASRHRILRIGPRAALVLAIASAASLLMFCWPLVITPPAGFAHSADAPFVFIAVLPALIAIVLAELGERGIDGKTMAMLGVCSAIGAALRPIGAGTAGVETVFFLLVLAGRVYGPGFGYVLGATTLFGSALLTGGVGPWLPFQMMAASWVGLGAGFLPRARGRPEIAMLALYGAVSAYAYGFLMNLWYWPFAIGSDTQLSYVPGGSVLENLHRFFIYTVTTSSFGWDTGRAITNGVAILLLGPAVLAVLRRAARRAAFTTPVAFDAPIPDI